MKNYQKLLAAVLAIGWFGSVPAGAQLYTEGYFRCKGQHP